MQPAPVSYRCRVAAFIGFAHLLRRRAFHEVGGYREDLHFYGEEKGLCAQLLKAGYQVVYMPDVLVAHVPDPGGRSTARYLRYVVRNDCLFALHNLPWPAACVQLPGAPGALFLDEAQPTRSRSFRVPLDCVGTDSCAAGCLQDTHANDLGEPRRMAPAAPSSPGLARMISVLFVNSGILGMASFAQFIRDAMTGDPEIAASHINLSEDLSVDERCIRALLCARLWHDGWFGLKNMDLERLRANTTRGFRPAAA